MKEWMFESLDYDLWANRRWADALSSVSTDLVTGPWAERIGLPNMWPDFPAGGDRTTAIFSHILWAQRIWITRCGVTVALHDSSDARNWIAPLHEAWSRLMDRGDVYDWVDYKNTAGVPGRRTLGEIARHVLNHSTYHRGQLREAAEAVPGLVIPGTDLVSFFISRDA